MRALVIYDLTGYIWNVIYGADEEPNGLLCMWVDIPSNANLVKIDVSDPTNHQPVFNYINKETDIKTLQDKVAQIENKLNPVFDAANSTLEEAKEYMIKMFSEQCTAAIYKGREVETSKGKYLFGFDNNDQINLKEAFDFAYLTNLPIPYHADKIDCAMWSALDIVKIYSANIYGKTYHTTYCNLLNNICRASNDKDYVLSLYYGMALPPEQNAILYKLMTEAETLSYKLIYDFEQKYPFKEEE